MFVAFTHATCNVFGYIFDRQTHQQFCCYFWYEKCRKLPALRSICRVVGSQVMCCFVTSFSYSFGHLHGVCVCIVFFFRSLGGSFCVCFWFKLRITLCTEITHRKFEKKNTHSHFCLLDKPRVLHSCQCCVHCPIHNRFYSHFKLYFRSKIFPSNSNENTTVDVVVLSGLFCGSTTNVIFTKTWMPF